MTVSIVTTANSIRYGSANTETVLAGVGCKMGVDGLDATGVGGRSNSVGDRAGEGMVNKDPAGRGVGAAIDE